MAVIYPPGWCVLQWSQVRAELIEYLKSALSFEAEIADGEMAALVHFIFDDHDFADDLPGILGFVLFDEKEIEAVQNFVGCLDRAIGPREKKLSDVTKSDWEPVAEAARQALDQLLVHGQRTFS
jgi:uncharacterized protein Usg